MTNDVYDVVIRGGTVVTEDGVQLADVAVTSGRIAALLTPGTETAEGF